MSDVKEVRARGFCFTLNNYTEEDIEIFKSLEDKTRPKIKYGIIGKETGENGTPHLQGYLYFEHANKGNFKNVKKWFSRAHIEIAHGSPKQNFDYCSKDKDYISFGKVPEGSGARSDLRKVKDDVKEGKVTNLREYLDDEENKISFQNIRVTEKLLEVYSKPRKLSSMPTVYWKFGATGCGKSRDCYTWLEDKDYYVCSDNGKWWNGYDGQEYVLIDDWRIDFCKFSQLLKILDRNPCKVETKGGMKELRAHTFFITSPYDPVELYINNIGRDRDDPKQLCRRITQVEEYAEDGSYDIINPMDLYHRYRDDTRSSDILNRVY